MHLVIYFCGTNEGKESSDNPIFSFGESKDREYLYNNEHVATLMVQGCWHKDVCNDWAFPNLASFAKRFVSKLFTSNSESTLNLDSNNINVNNTIGIIKDRCGSQTLNNPAITEITLCGYSRGAATCFNVARELNKTAPSIPVNIVANQPVSGSLYAGFGTNAGSIIDCSDLTNLKNVSIILGTHTLDTDRTHRAFYAQIVPGLSRTTQIKKEIIVIPRCNHYDGPSELQGRNIPFGERHLHMQVAKYLFEGKLVTDALVKEKIAKAKASYSDATDFWKDFLGGEEEKPTPNFPRIDKLQTFFGITSRELYRYKDPLHPAPYLSSHYEWSPDSESLINWWNKHDKENSYFMSDLTKSLIESIQSISNDRQMLLNFFKQVETWLILKTDTKSSRYYLMTALKNNIYHELIKSHNIEPAELNAISHKLQHENHYFQQHWQILSKAASFWKTEETEKLDLAFESHSTNELSKENDQKLLAALNTWLKEKEGSNSKRWDIVVEIRDTLEDAIKASFLKENTENNDNDCQFGSM